MSPVLTLDVVQALLAAAAAGRSILQCTLDLGRSVTQVTVDAAGFDWQGQHYAYPDPCKDRTIYHWDGQAFAPASRYSGSLIKLVPTDWGAPTFEIDGIKMLPTAKVSPYADAQRKVGLIAPRGKRVLDTCGGLGYFADCCLQSGAQQVVSFEKNADVLWLRQINPWSPRPADALSLTHGDISQIITTLPDASFDAVLHDPPRFGIAGELYSFEFYSQLARVLRRQGWLFHYTGTPNKLTSGRDVPAEVAKRLQQAGFKTAPQGDGLLAQRR
jgi:predicted methyltransferase